MAIHNIKHTNNIGKKLDDNIENPIDLILLNITTELNPYYKGLHFTPNILTTLSLIITLLGLYLHYKGYYVIGGILYFIGYYFDCADGNFARTYNMATKFGDYYDHITDLIKFSIFVYLIYSYRLSRNTNIFIITVISVLLCCSAIFYGCQDKIYSYTNNNKNNIGDSLLFLKKLCYNDNAIYYYKYGSTGTLQLFCSILLMFLPWINKVLT